MVGSSILKLLREKGFNNILTLPKSELDLSDRINVETLLKSESPKMVIIAAAKVGGILSNSQNPYDFILQNLKIQTIWGS